MCHARRKNTTTHFQHRAQQLPITATRGGGHHMCSSASLKVDYTDIRGEGKINQGTCNPAQQSKCSESTKPCELLCPEMPSTRPAGTGRAALRIRARSTECSIPSSLPSELYSGLLARMAEQLCFVVLAPPPCSGLKPPASQLGRGINPS